MLTQSMPALAQALSGVLPDPALRQLMQALGNCQQPLTHRGDVNLQPSYVTGPGGVATRGTWSPVRYRSLLPTAGTRAFVDMPGYGGRGGGGYGTISNSNNYGGHQFSFPMDQNFAYNSYFGGDTFNVAGDSTFTNSFHNNINASNSSIVNLNVTRLTLGDPATGPTLSGDGGGFSDGGGGGGAGLVINAGGGIGLAPPAVIRTDTFLKSVTVRGTVDAPTVDKAALKDDAVTVENKLVTKTVTSNGTITLPTVEGVSLTAFTASGAGTVTTLTGGTVSGGTASGDISYDTYPTATCGAITGSVDIFSGGSISAGTASGTLNYDTYPTATCGAITGSVDIFSAGTISAGTASGTISYDNYPTATCSAITGSVDIFSGATLSSATATGNINYDTYPTATCGAITGTVDIFSGGTFSATPTGISAAATVGNLLGTVTVPVVTGGYVDSDCKLQLTTSNQAFAVNFSGAPSVFISSQGTVAGTVILTGSTTRQLTISTPTITLNKKADTATASLPVSGTVTLTGSTTRSVTISTPSITMTKKSDTASASLTVSGNVTLSGSTAREVTISTPAVTLTKQTGTATASLSVSGNVSLTGSTTRPLTLSTPAITLTKTSATAAASLSVSGITFSPVTGKTDVSVSLTTASASFDLTNGSTQQDFSATGNVEVNEAQSSAKVTDTTVTLTPGSVSKTLNLTVGKTSDFIIYLRPRF